MIKLIILNKYGNKTDSYIFFCEDIKNTWIYFYNDTVSLCIYAS